MKRIISVVALVCATVLAVSCRKEDNQDSVYNFKESVSD